MKDTYEQHYLTNITIHDTGTTDDPRRADDKSHKVDSARDILNVDIKV